MKKFISLLLMITSILVQAQTKTEQIDAIITSEISEKDPGIMVGVVKDGNIIYEKYHGLSNIENQVKMSDKTRSNIASTAKQFTALMVLKLSLDGKLNLEDDIRLYLPDLYKSVKDSIKIRHLINHTSGIRDYVELMDLEGQVWWKRVGLDNGDIMAILEKQEDLGFAPGSKYSYSNSGYVVLAELIAMVTQQKFTDYAIQFFKTLGMGNTAFAKRYMEVIPNRAEPYSDWGYGELFHSISVTKTAGEGFLYTTLKDQLQYEQALQNAQKQNNELLILSQKSIPNSRVKSYGFGLKLNDRLGRTAVHHDGVTNAYNAQALRFPEEKLSVFIMSNNGNIRSDLIANKIASVFLPKKETPMQYHKDYTENTSAKPFQIEGQYNYPNSDKLVRIVKDKGTFFWKEGNYYNLEMIPEGNNRFAFSADPKLKIVFYQNEMVEYYPSGKTKIYKRNKTKPASFSDLENFVGKYHNNELNIDFEIALTEENNLKLQFANDNNVQNVQVFNRRDLLAGNNYVLKAYRDRFDKVTELLLDYDRAKNIRFKKNVITK